MPNPTEDRAIREAERRALTNVIADLRKHDLPAGAAHVEAFLHNEYPAPEPEWIVIPETQTYKRMHVRYIDGELHAEYYDPYRCTWDRVSDATKDYCIATHDAIAQAKANAERDA